MEEERTDLSLEDTMWGKVWGTEWIWAGKMVQPVLKSCVPCCEMRVRVVVVIMVASGCLASCGFFTLVIEFCMITR